VRNQEIRNLFLNRLVQALGAAKNKLLNKWQAQKILDMALRPLGPSQR
jgi:hypothetical protein